MALSADDMADVWADYRRITRFFASAQIAFERERLLIDSLSLRDPDSVMGRVPLSTGSYRFSVTDHLAALADVQALYSAVLTQTYTLAETAALASFTPPGDSRSSGGIEVWGKKLLDAQDKVWADVPCGKSGLVEVAVARNLSVHGDGRLGAADVRRLSDAGTPHWSVGDHMPLDSDITTNYRGRLKDLLNAGGIGEGRRPAQPQA